MDSKNTHEKGDLRNSKLFKFYALFSQQFAMLSAIYRQYMCQDVRIAKNITMPAAKCILIVTYNNIRSKDALYKCITQCFSFSMLLEIKDLQWHTLVLVYCRLTLDLLGPSGCSSSCAIFATDYLGKISVLICTR